MPRAMIAVFGGNQISAEVENLAEALGRSLVDAGFRVVCGGLGGVMAAVACGARSSARWTGAEVIGLLPGWTKDEQANPWVDVALATDMGSQRNNLIARVADAAVAIGGGAGTLSEIALAWHEGKPLGCLANTGGWAERLAGERLDDRRAQAIVRLADVDAALAWLDDLLPQGAWPQRESGPWWPVRVPWLRREGLDRGELEAKLRALAQEVSAWNDARAQRRRALVTIDEGHVESLELIPIFAALPQLQPVLFVRAASLAEPLEPLRDAGWSIGCHAPDQADHGAALLEARRALLALGGVPWLAWPEGRGDDELRARGRAAGFAWQFACAPGPELIVRSRWPEPDLR